MFGEALRIMLLWNWSSCGIGGATFPKFQTCIHFYTSFTETFTSTNRNSFTNRIPCFDENSLKTLPECRVTVLLAPDMSWMWLLAHEHRRQDIQTLIRTHALWISKAAPFVKTMTHKFSHNPIFFSFIPTITMDA